MLDLWITGVCPPPPLSKSKSRTPTRSKPACLIRMRGDTQLSPHILGERERPHHRAVLTYGFDEPINQRLQPRFGHVGDQIVEQAALPKQRMGSALGGVDLQMPIHAEALAGRAEQRQQNDREGVQQKQPVASLRIGDAKSAHAHAEAQVLRVAKVRRRRAFRRRPR
jgi:hypothetical protein